MSGGGINYSESDNSNLILQQIKEEPQVAPASPPQQQLNPIDMESQERIKLERKRQRNRVAASKCRKRKLGKSPNVLDIQHVINNRLFYFTIYRENIKIGRSRKNTKG